MIRVFDAFRKSLFYHTPDLLLFSMASEDFSERDFSCPRCRAKGSVLPISPYQRYLISYEAGEVVRRIVDVKQMQCTSCRSIHAILPDCLVPYSSYSLSFMLTVLKEYFLEKTTVQQLCDHFQIAISTLYAWVKLFHRHKALWLGVLIHAEVSPSSFLQGFFDSHFAPDRFFSTYQCSFLQCAFTTFSNSS